MDKSLIYLDNAATSYPKPEAVGKAMLRALTEAGGNPGRSGHRMSLAANRVIFEARENVAALLGVTESARVIFTSGATESLNLAIKGLVRKGDHVITSVLEHNAVAQPLNSLMKQGVAVTRIGCDSDGFFDPESMRRSIKGNTSLIVLTHASNVIGAIEPVEEMAAIARASDVPFLLDASQTAGLVPLDAETLGIDMLAASGHKGMLGPQGTGLLYVGSRVMPSPLKEGGTGSGPSDDDQPEALPDRFEAGTMNTPGIAGLGAAAAFLLERGVDNVRKREVLLLQRLMEGLKAIDGVVLYGPRDVSTRVSLVSFNLTGRDPAMVAFTLDEEFGIMTRSGLHCAPDVHRFFNLYPAGCVRISPGIFNSEEDMDALVRAVREIARR